jgi:hypothetical protein
MNYLQVVQVFSRIPIGSVLDVIQQVAKLVVEEMPHLPFERTLTSLHGDVRKMLPMLIPA